ncbi:hypothetical protein [Paenibacillus brevis]|uniref:Copper amine oxidase N-terminal domain-containing protein n=1 Tax=Paenibacillus brevis TaxID=2841508 RepID=A0ABS6FKR8_9BACL|nr:hypothetical protein [Paenibacillus brevis]MBU5670739.1 hypothetical protein [Paenibacillus brevis]
MKKLVGIMIFSSALVLSGMNPLAGDPSPRVSILAALAPSDETTNKFESETDIAKIYLIKHRMTMELGSDKTKGNLDGSEVQVDPASLRDGHMYISLRTLKLSGAAASVGWDAQKQEAKVTMKPELSSSWQELIFRAGSSGAFRPNGNVLAGAEIPELLLSEGRVYIPVKSLSLLGIAASADQGRLVLEWSEKFIEVTKQLQESKGTQVTFSALYQQEMYAPQILTSYGSGAWGGGTGRQTGSGIDLDGRIYNRMEYTVELRPGVNPLRLYAVSAGMADFSVTRTVDNPEQIPVSFTEQGAEYVELILPESGYVKLNAGKELTLAGGLKKAGSGLDELTIIQQRYESDDNDAGKPGYKTVNTATLSISEGEFNGKIFFPEPGDYLLQVYSPRYIPMPESEPASVLWAELVVKVE